MKEGFSFFLLLRSKFAFKRNVYRYEEVAPAVGLCRLNQVDPYPMTYSLSNS
jgi:hypothetical protein